MKLTVFAAALAATTAFAAQMNVGIVDAQLLVRNHSSYQNNSDLLKNTQKDYQKRIEAMGKEVEATQEEMKKLSEAYANPMNSAQAKAKLEKDMLSLQNKYIQQQQKVRSENMRLQQELMDLEARLLKTVADDLKKITAKYAAKNDYDLIIENSAVFYASKSIDVTDDILKEMGVDPAKARSREDDESK